MNSPPEALSPSPSTPSSGSPSPDDIGPFSLSSSNAGRGSSAQTLPTNPLASPTSAQAKRRLPPTTSSTFSAREGRENKSRRRDRDRDGDRDIEGPRRGAASLETFRSDAQIQVGLGQSHAGTSSSRMREELVDIHMVDYVRNTYGDPLDDTVLKQRSS